MTFEFRKTDLYIDTSNYYSLLITLTSSKKCPPYLKNQMVRAGLSICLNFAEGYGRYHKADKKNFFIRARASINEVVCCFDQLKVHLSIPDEEINSFNQLSLSVYKQLSGLIKILKE